MKRIERINIREILANPVLHKQLMIDCIIGIQAIEGIKTTRKQAERAYEKIKNEKKNTH